MNQEKTVRQREDESLWHLMRLVPASILTRLAERMAIILGVNIESAQTAVFQVYRDLEKELGVQQ